MNNKLPLTKPISPFTARNTLPYRIRIAQHVNTKPSQQLRNYQTIEWFRKRCGDYAVKRSLQSLLPINSASSAVDSNNNNHLLINPKYLYNDITFHKIKLLRDIFLAFDEDCSRKMEIDELLQMFKENELNVKFDDLVELFFNKKKVIMCKEKDKQLYLNFWEFVLFALEKDAEFRKFMRRLKEKYLHDNNHNGRVGEFLPMSFDVLLDYFIMKGKERDSKGKVTSALQAMDNVVKYIKHKEMKTKGVLPEIPFDDTQFEKINFEQLFKEFALLMKVDRKETSKNEDNVNEQVNTNKKEEQEVTGINEERKKKSGKSIRKISAEEMGELLFKLDLREEKVDKDGDPVFLSVIKKLQEKKKKNEYVSRSGRSNSSTKGNSGYNVVLPVIKGCKGRLVRNRSCGRFNVMGGNKGGNKGVYMSRNGSGMMNNFNSNNNSISNNNSNEFYSSIIKQYLHNE